jgi:NADPH:quinone reductase-like Zn-dependent oxidoreductase
VGGVDPSGEVVELGEGVDSLSPGQRVVIYPVLTCGECDFCRRGGNANYRLNSHHCRNWRLWGVQTWGGRSEYAAVPAANLVPLPDHVPLEVAAALPISYVTAWHGLVDKGGLSADDTVLILGAAGGCGAAAIQIANIHGARAIAISGAAWKRERALELGADAAFDYHEANWAEKVREATSGTGVTLAFDNAGKSTWPQTFACLDRGGRFVCSGTTTGSDIAFDARWAYRELISMRFYMGGSRANLESLVELIDEGRLDPVVDSSEQKLAVQNHFGKILLTPGAVGRQGHSAGEEVSRA